MSTAIGLGAAIAAVVIGGYWALQIVDNSRRRAIDADARQAVVRDLVLAVFSVGALALLSAHYLRDIHVDTPEATEMGTHVEDARSLLIAALAFLICFGLSSAIIRGIYPDPGTKRNRVFSEATALILSAILALTVATNQTLNNSMADMIANRGGDMVITFLSIVFGAAAVFLAWKRISASVRPTSASRKSSTDTGTGDPGTRT